MYFMDLVEWMVVEGLRTEEVDNKQVVKKR